MFVLLAAVLVYGQRSVPWSFAGPRGYVQNGDPLKLKSASAIQQALAVGDSSWLVATVNGGIFKANISMSELTRSTSENIHWENVLDKSHVTCASISTLAQSPTNSDEIFAGCGGVTSSEQGNDWSVLNDGDWAGVMKSQDGGDTWSMLKTPLVNYHVTSILPLAGGRLVVSARSSKFDQNKGGVWVFDGSKWTQTLHNPVFNMQRAELQASIPAIFAALPFAVPNTVMVSIDQGLTWKSWSEGLFWGWPELQKPHQPYYPTFAVDNKRLFVGALTVDPHDVTNTSSRIFVRSLDFASAGEWVELAGDKSMDDDAMPKDRMGMVVDPVNKNLYVVGNGAKVAFRVDVTEGTWEDMTGQADTADGSVPHGDCRNTVIHKDVLVVVSDGGIWARLDPRTKKGKNSVWLSLNGDIPAMEFLSAHWDNRQNRWVGGAQDNCVQVANAGDAESTALGFLFGDGTTTQVDNIANPSRLFGSTQFLGVGDVDSKNQRQQRRKNFGDDDEAGFGFFQGDISVHIPVSVWFPEADRFPFFVHPFGLNDQSPTDLIFWVGQSKQNSAPAGFWKLTIPLNISSTDQLVKECKPVFLSDSNSAQIYALVASGTSVVAINNTHLHRLTLADNGLGSHYETHVLPAVFAQPVVLGYRDNAAVLGPLSHDKTVTLAVSTASPSFVAVTGWLSVLHAHPEPEGIWFSRQNGEQGTFVDISGNLKEVSGALAFLRPSGLLFVDFEAKGNGNKTAALLVGTVSGVFMTWIDKALEHVAAGTAVEWDRVGDSQQFPLVLTKGLSYEHYSDTLVAATMGRGIYTLHNAKAHLLDSRFGESKEESPWTTASSAKYFPAQL
mmetsp:Transcript_10726/g.20357  ORF Transcript_10726/g.20357 Transcript_10726/m.20357 type:complete len:839 (+) Transcript_10726:24-2540(+)